ncbi:hypothetical protein ABK040_009184 [Willaertia magna]
MISDQSPVRKSLLKGDDISLRTKGIRESFLLGNNNVNKNNKLNPIENKSPSFNNERLSPVREPSPLRNSNERKSINDSIKNEASPSVKKRPTGLKLGHTLHNDENNNTLIHRRVTNNTSLRLENLQSVQALKEKNEKSPVKEDFIEIADDDDLIRYSSDESSESNNLLEESDDEEEFLRKMNGEENSYDSKSNNILFLNLDAVEGRSPSNSNLRSSSSFSSFFEESLTGEVLEEYLSENKLRVATGQDDLLNVKYLEIIVNTTNNSLGDLGSKVPNLEELKLNNSTIPSVRDLGTSLRNVKILWLSRCGLSELDGIFAFPRLKELYLSFNDIEDISNLSSLRELEILDLEGNNIENEGQVLFLQGCKKLISLTLDGNPFSRINTYREIVASYLPNLEYLDDKNIKREKQIITSGVIDSEDNNEIYSSKQEQQLQKFEELDSELEMLKKSIKYTKIEQLDETLHENPLILTVSDRLFNPTENNLIRNVTPSTPRLEGGRPQSATFFKRPTTSSGIFTGNSINLRSSISSIRSSSVFGRPCTSNIRPFTSMSISSLRPPSARSSSSASVRESMSILENLKKGNEEEIVNSSSDLTYGSKEVFCGNIVKSLRSKKHQPSVIVTTNPGSGESEINFLEEIQQQKIKIAEKEEIIPEVEQFLNSVYEGYELEDEVNSEEFFTPSPKTESFDLDSIPLVEDVFDLNIKKRKKKQ